jgi:hypothetical protein
MRIRPFGADPAAPGVGGRGEAVGEVTVPTSLGLRCEFKECCTSPGLLEPLLHESAGIGWVKPDVPPAPVLPGLRHMGGACERAPPPALTHRASAACAHSGGWLPVAVPNFALVRPRSPSFAPAPHSTHPPPP